MEEYREVRRRTMEAVLANMEGEREKVTEAAEKVADAVMEAIADNYRSITEVHSIVECVRAGIRVQIAYADPDELDFMDPYTVRPCW
ncbi:hypothetical protein C819_00513 [Lachnospiraceae bacterium 10-1]|nr:hypothetical protein C819_00513 [Lachnospiraceae bacterium 10-1]